MSFYDDTHVETITSREKQILELSKTIVELRGRVKDLEQELEVRDKIPIPKTVIRQILEMEAVIKRLAGDVEYYKKYVPVEKIINRENKRKPTRRGGIPR